MPQLERQAIRSFYCAYLLRSTINNAKSYIGSTPNPRRRLAQHNGDAPGGAHNTNKSLLKPWEMVCIVAGFPSSIAALQFEWTWQNPHISTKILPDQRLTGIKCKTKHGRTRLARPRTITAKLQGLHLLLRIEAFSRWPLSVRFFVTDIYNLWNRWCQREGTSLPKSIKIVLDLRHNDVDNGLPVPSGQVPGAKKRVKGRWSANGEGGMQGLDISNSCLERHLQKSRDILHPGSENICNICHETFTKDYSSVVVCPHAFCEHIAHITCLADEFLQQEEPTDLGHKSRLLQPVLPVEGKCPGCKKETPWVDLVKELSVRTRTKTEPKTMMTKKGSTELKEDDESGDDEDDEDDEGNITAADLARIVEELVGDQIEWGDDTDTDSALSDIVREARSVKSGKVTRGSGKTRGKKAFPTVIEDSDEEPVVSDVGSEMGSVKDAKKARKGKGKGKTQAKKTLPVVEEDSDMDSAFSDAANDTVQRGSKSKKGRGCLRGETAPQVTIGDSDSNSMLGLAASVKDGGKVRKAKRGLKKVLPAVVGDSNVDSILCGTASLKDGSKVKRGRGRPKKVLPVVIEDSDWDGVETIV